jgi:hypothetical protein
MAADLDGSHSTVFGSTGQSGWFCIIFAHAIVERSLSSLSNRGSHHEYRRYHYALLHFLKAKRRIVEKRAKEV